MQKQSFCILFKVSYKRNVQIIYFIGRVIHDVINLDSSNQIVRKLQAQVQTSFKLPKSSRNAKNYSNINTLNICVIYFRVKMLTYFIVYTNINSDFAGDDFLLLRI
ncbi:uncharacterized protein DS421_11g340180 [Arachis hypogaea]|nr:uncharacterized protein DS421_11g340180 [Arachis hypogaea]